jgi:hypothetical protein
LKFQKFEIINNIKHQSEKMNIQQIKCPLCKAAKKTTLFHRGKRRNYFQCLRCSLVFVDPDQFLSKKDEKAEYDLHLNLPDDTGYQNFLKRIIVPMQKGLEKGSSGLDFGSGPGPVLSEIFKKAGFPMALYDRFYAPDLKVFEKQYDFITATEVVEHLHDPGKELDRLWTCLKPGGRLGIMTKLVMDKKAFASWHYKRDLTHVCFFSKTTFKWLAELFRAEITFAEKDVIIFYKI